MAKITYKDLFGTDILKSFKKELKEVDALIKDLPKIDLKLKGDGKELKTHSENIEKLQVIEGKLETQRVKFTSLEKQRNKAQLDNSNKLAKEQKRNADALDRQRQKALQTSRKAEFAEENLQKAINKTVKSQKDLREQTNALKKVRDRLDTSTAKGRKAWNDYTASILRNNKALIKNDEQIDQHQRKVGKYENAFKKVGAGLKNIGGALGITAGIAILTQGFQVLADKAGVLIKSQKQIAFIFGVTGDEARDLTADISALATTFDVEFKDIQESANAVSKELKIGVPEALALIEEGFKKGSNANGEFLETLKEYPAQFAAAGIDAKTMFAIINQTVKEGIYSDKGVDAIKEGGLRLRENTKAVQDALRPLDDSIKKQIEQEIASGNSFKAIQLVSGALKDSALTANETQAIIAGVFGGAGEDAGLRYLQTLSDIDTNLDNVKNQTSSVQDATLEFNKSFNKIILDVANGTSGIGKFVAELIGLGTTIVDSLLKGNALTDVFKSIGEEFSTLFGLLGKVASIFGSVGDQVSIVEGVFKFLSFTLKTSLIPIRLIIAGITKLIEGFFFVVRAVRFVNGAIVDAVLKFEIARKGIEIFGKVINTVIAKVVKDFNFFKDAIISLLTTLGILEAETGPGADSVAEVGKESEKASESVDKLAESEKKAAEEIAKTTEATKAAVEATKAYNTALEGLRAKSKSTYEGLVTDVFEKNEINRANELTALDDSLSDLSKNQQAKIKLTGDYKNTVNAINLKFDTEEQKLQRAKIKKEEEALNKENNRRIKQSNDDFKSLQKVSAQQFRAEIIELKKAGGDKDEIAIKEKEFKIVQLQNYLDFVKTHNSELTEEQKLALQNTINELGIELDEFKKGVEGEGLSSIIAKKLGLTEEGLAEIVGAVGDLAGDLADAYGDELAKESEALDEKKSLSDERIELLNDEFENFEETKSKEAEIKENEITAEQARIDKLIAGGVAADDAHLISLQKQLADQQAIDAQKDVIKQAQTAKDLADEKVKNTKIEAEQKRVAEKQKKLALARSLINTAVSVGNALASVPFPANLVVAGLVGAKGFLEYRKIQAQEFAEGTEFVQRKGAPSGIDTVPAMLTEGERVMSVNDSVRIPKGFKNSQIPDAVNYYLNRSNKRETGSDASHNYFDVLNGIKKNTNKNNRNQIFDKNGRLISEKIGNITNRYN